MSTIDNTAGAMFVGCLLSVLFCGATMTQTVAYIQNCHSDVWIVKAVVTLAITLDLVHTVLVTHGSYIYVIKSIDHSERLAQVPWSLLALVLVTCSSVAIVRLLFVRRIWYLSNRNRVVTGIPIILSMGSFVVAVCAGIRVLSLPTFLLIDDAPWVVYATTGSDVVADISIAGTLWFYLSRMPTGYQRTSNLLQSLSHYIIGTGAVTVLWDVLEIVTFATLHKTLIFTIFFLSLSNLYTNALLALLNARPMMNRKLDHSATHFQFPEAEVTCRRAQINCNRTSSSMDDVMELASSPNAKVVTLEMGHGLSSDNASSSESSEKINRI
ncbi:hypothetical protein SCHPADRAFT_441390 [Schizopora paradoxa]|uniref:DUF6534 domain-containing protein n=1 Tax=Schizopora paradoxa TaxID=27342 RepID=A0A0H2RKB6_9AGAM|nr:hypothetical protein SCHPADRAFT_441390 [Schizopora paradoxa]